MREIKNKACFVCLDNLYSPLRGKCRVMGVEIRLCIWECDYLRKGEHYEIFVGIENFIAVSWH